MRSTDTLIIGAGQAGLAASHALAALGIAHAVLERGRVAERWRSERWDSLRLLTPSWLIRLPGLAPGGGDPDGFMTMPEVVALLDSYARAGAAPVQEGTEVRGLRPGCGGWLAETGGGTWRARVVIVANGHCGLPRIPDCAAAIDPAIHQLAASAYRNPQALPPGGVLVVGAAASAVQIAEELRAAGRRVVLAAGRHTRAPRRYRGRDIWWWMDRAGMLADRAEDQPDIARARAQSSFQLVGGTPPRDIGLDTLHAAGVRITGRVLGAAGTVLELADDLPASLAGAQRPMASLLARIDRLADALGAPRDAWPAPVLLPPAPTRLDLRAEGIGTILWATGYRRDHRWLRVPGLAGGDGELRHAGGVTPAPGLYLLGLRFMRTRSSNFLGGVGADALAIAAEAARHLSHTPGRQAA